MFLHGKNEYGRMLWYRFTAKRASEPHDFRHHLPPSRQAFTRNEGGRRPLSHQAPRGLVPDGLYAPGFDDTYLLNDASSKGLLSFVSRMLTCTGLYPRFSSNAHHHGSLPQQLGSVWDLLLKADPEGPSLISCAACHPHGDFSSW